MKEKTFEEASDNSEIKIRIEIFDSGEKISGDKYFGAEIYLNDKWFKEITGLSSKKDVINAILTNEDFLTTITKINMEKTFDELIEEVEYNFDSGNFVLSDTVEELLQQVREATIAECEERIIELEGEIYREGITGVFDVLPHDRIKLTENK